MITDPIAHAALTTRLADARSAYHSLMTGISARVVVDQNGDRVEFTAANRSALASYIIQLESQLGCVQLSMRPARPIGFTF